jgi:glycosyltransferase involved in cell wall biosynthesis
MVAPAERVCTADRGRAATRVLWLINQLGAGGAERLLLAARACHDPQLYQFDAAYLLRWNDALVGDFEAVGVKVHCLGVDSPYDVRWVWRLWRLLARSDYDLVHVHSPLAATAARVLVRVMPGARRPALVVTEHASWPSYRLVTRVLNTLTFHLDDAHLAVSDDAWRAMPARLRRRTSVVVHGVLSGDLAELRGERAAVRRELGVADNDVVVMTVANLVAEKDYPNLLRAARAAVDRAGHLRFVAIGQGPLERDLRALHQALGLGDRFVFLGYRRDAVRLLAGADIFTLASRFEGLPVAVMEALTMGLPIVATAVGGVPAAVRDGVEGVIVPRERHLLLAGALVDLSCDEPRRRQMARAALDRSRHYDMRRCIGVLEQLYGQALSGSRRPKG